MAVALPQSVPRSAPWRIVHALRQGKRYPVVPVVILMLVLVIPAIFASQVAPQNPVKGSLSKRLQPPVWMQGGSTEHLLGTDKLGRDILSRIIHGARVSLLVSLVAVLFAGSIGTVLGLLAGYFGGKLETVIMCLVDISLALPTILLALVLVAAVGSSFATVITVVAVILWARYARQVRGETLSVKEHDFIARARVAGASHVRIMVQAVFQDPWSSLSPRMLVRQIVAEPLVINRRVSNAEVEERVNEVLASVGLRPEHANLYPHEFSGGQRQRIAMASALISQPKLIVLDEPVSALDVSIRAQIMNLLVDLQQQYNVSYLLIAHHLATTRYMAHEVAVMYLGQIVEHAKTEELFTKPLHPYTQALFSAALPAHPDIQREEIILPGEVPSPINPPRGCRFHPRCPAALPDCVTIEPKEQELTPGHTVACHLYA